MNITLRKLLDKAVQRAKAKLVSNHRSEYKKLRAIEYHKLLRRLGK